MKNFCHIVSEPTEITEIKEGRSPDRPGGLPASAPKLLRRGSENVVPCDESARGWVLYDGQCRFCTASAKRFRHLFDRRGFHFIPLQTPWVQQHLGLAPGAPLDQMRVLTKDGRDFAGADAFIFLTRKIWWAWPFYALTHLPGMHAVTDHAYRWVAAHRGCTHIKPQPTRLLEWLALVSLPLLALQTRGRIQPWAFMWLMAGAIFFGCKWLTFWRARVRHPDLRFRRALAYFFLWPGMDAAEFLGPGSNHRRHDRSLRTILFAFAKIIFGMLLLFRLARLAPNHLLAGWLGMIGIILILHFGIFDLLAITWRVSGINARPIMNAPLKSTSLGEFWGRRWNGAFNQLVLEILFRPLTRTIGAIIGTLAAFFASGLIHECVISLPARGGYGLPTAYFLLQGCGVIVQHQVTKLRRGISGRIFTIFIVAAPVFWLFHPPFVHRVIIPFMKAIGAS